jgi:hypothetical protein
MLVGFNRQAIRELAHQDHKYYKIDLPIQQRRRTIEWPSEHGVLPLMTTSVRRA